MAGAVLEREPEPDHAPPNERPLTLGELQEALDKAGVTDLAGLAQAVKRGKSAALHWGLSVALGAGAGAGTYQLRDQQGSQLPTQAPELGPAAAPEPAPARELAPAPAPAQQCEQCEEARVQCEAADASERRCTQAARRVLTVLDAIADECGIGPALRAREFGEFGMPEHASGTSGSSTKETP
jgi:hypothetical protein